MSRSLVATALLLACALPVEAQSAYSAGDTLRYREVTQGKLLITMPQGEIPVTLQHSATIGVVRMRGDSARAWYDSLVLSASSPAGEQRPATDSALKQPFRLGFDSRGRVRLVQAPKFPASFEGMGDLSHQFNDFFLRLPARPLAVGLAWTDSSSRTDSTADKRTHWSTNASYRVERDTIVDGTPALVVSMRQRLRIGGEAPVPAQQMRASTMMEGTEDGYVVFAPRAGRVLARRREGRLDGDIVMRGAQGEMTMKQAYTYSSTIDAVK